MGGQLRVLDLFSGIGGFSRGLERAGGFETVAFCESDPYCRAVLNKHWPDVPIYDDVRTFSRACLQRDGVIADVADAAGARSGDSGIDLICGGFPCQDLSYAGKGAGINGERSGLWREFARIIGEIRPCYALIENVSALLGRGLSRVLCDLAALRYSAEWHCIPACAVGAPHRRDRVWIVAYPCGIGRAARRATGDVAEAARAAEGEEDQRQRGGHATHDSGAVDSDPDRGRRELERQQEHGNEPSASGREPDRLGARRRGDGAHVAYTCRPRLEIGVLLAAVQSGARFPDAGQDSGLGGWWESESGLGVLADGPTAGLDGIAEHWRYEPAIPRVARNVPNRVAQLRALGNSLVPQIPELIGRAILEYELISPSGQTLRESAPQASA